MCEDWDRIEGLVIFAGRSRTAGAAVTAVPDLKRINLIMITKVEYLYLFPLQCF